MRNAGRRTVLGGALLALGLLAGTGCESTHEYFDVGTDVHDTSGDGADVGDGGEVVGTASCSEVLTCMQGCASDLSCVTACEATVCPADRSLLEALMTCVAGSCAADCADFSASACQTCVMSSCSADGLACYGGTCG